MIEFLKESVSFVTRQIMDVSQNLSMTKIYYRKFQLSFTAYLYHIFLLIEFVIDFFNRLRQLESYLWLWDKRRILVWKNELKIFTILINICEL